MWFGLDADDVTRADSMRARKILQNYLPGDFL
jgi:hypothetical protein